MATLLKEREERKYEPIGANATRVMIPELEEAPNMPDDRPGLERTLKLMKERFEKISQRPDFRLPKTALIYIANEKDYFPLGSYI